MAPLNKHFRSTAMAAGTIKNDYKNYGTGHIVSHVYHLNNTAGIAKPTVIKNTVPRQINMPESDIDHFQQIRMYRSHIQNASQEAFLRYMQNQNHRPSASYNLIAVALSYDVDTQETSNHDALPE